MSDDDQDYIDRETIACENIYKCMLADLRQAAREQDLSEVSMAECLWSILLMDMFAAGVKLEDMIDAVTRYYRNDLDDQDAC